MKTYKIHLIRHGLTDANLQGRYVGNRSDLPLCPEGVRELGLVREAVEYPDIEKLYSSPLLRARQSGNIIYPGFEPTVIEELTEYDFGEFEGQTATQLEINEAYLAWTSGKLDAPPMGEASSDFIKRIAMGINMVVRDMMESGVTNAGVIMHGGAIMMFLASCAVPRKHNAQWTSDPGRGYSIMVTPSLYHSSGIVEVYNVI